MPRLTKKYISTGRNMIIHTEMMTTASITTSRIFFLPIIIITEDATVTLREVMVASQRSTIISLQHVQLYTYNQSYWLIANFYIHINNDIIKAMHWYLILYDHAMTTWGSYTMMNNLFIITVNVRDLLDHTALLWVRACTCLCCGCFFLRAK